MKNCHVCTKKNLWTSTGNTIDGKREWKCRNCGNIQLEEPPQGLKIPPKVLYFDIETALMSVDLYDLRVYGYISKNAITRHSFVVNWAAAWVDRDYKIKGRIMSGVCTEREAKTQNDRRILLELHKLMDGADYWTGHNSDNFDVKKLNWRFLVNGIDFPSDAKRLDTIKMVRKYTAPPSKGLEFISVMFGGEKKKGLEDWEWRAIVAPKTEKTTREKLLKKANTYCRGDVKNGVLILRRYAKAIEGSGKVVVR